jgi:hypothetical protein
MALPAAVLACLRCFKCYSVCSEMCYTKIILRLLACLRLFKRYNKVVLDVAAVDREIVSALATCMDRHNGLN